MLVDVSLLITLFSMLSAAEQATSHNDSAQQLVVFVELALTLSSSFFLVMSTCVCVVCLLYVLRSIVLLARESFVRYVCEAMKSILSLKYILIN